MEAIYLNKNPTAKAILELVRSADDDQICYDHFAFRTFGVRLFFFNAKFEMEMWKNLFM